MKLIEIVQLVEKAYLKSFPNVKLTGFVNENGVPLDPMPNTDFLAALVVRELHNSYVGTLTTDAQLDMAKDVLQKAVDDLSYLIEDVNWKQPLTQTRKNDMNSSYFTIQKLIADHWTTVRFNDEMARIDDLNSARGIVHFFVNETEPAVNATYRIFDPVTKTAYPIYPPQKPSRETMIQEILDELPNWANSDPIEFWNHVRELERVRLYKLPNSEVEKEYDDVK